PIGDQTIDEATWSEPTRSSKEDLGDVVVEREVDTARSPDGHGERRPFDGAAAEHHHLAPCPVVHGISGGDAEPGRQHAIERGRRPSPLDVTQQYRTGVETSPATDLVGDDVA